MRVAFNLPGRENAIYRLQINEAITSVLDGGYYILGHHVRAFEAEFAAFCGVKHCVSVANGTDALEIALRAIGVNAGDEVVTVANAGGYSTIACNSIGAVPVYVDVNEDDLLMDVEQVKHALSPLTKCVVATHLFGQVVDVPSLRDELDRAGFTHVKILEDCAQAHGASRGGKLVGSLADIASFSFYPTKNLGALGDGGAIVTSDAAASERCLELRQYGWQGKYQSVTPYGRNSRLDDLQAAILSLKLKFLPELNERRRLVSQSLYQACSEHIDVVTKPSADNVCHLFVVRHQDREAMRKLLTSHEIATDIHYPLLDMDQGCMQQIPFRALAVPNAKRAANQIFSLPCYAALPDDELDYIKQVIHQMPQVVSHG